MAPTDPSPTDPPAPAAPTTRRLPLAYRVSAVARPIDPQWPTNRAILGIAAVCAVAAGVLALVQGQSWGSAAADVGIALVLVLMTWALGRELAPDDDPAAFVGVALLVVAWALGVRPEVWAPLALVGLSRFVNRTVGTQPKLTDLTIAVAAAAGLLAYDHWPLAVAAGLALLLDGRLPPRHLRALPFAALIAIATVVAWRTSPPVWSLPMSHLGRAALALSALFAVVISIQPPLRSRCDIVEADLDRRRVQGGMAVALLVALASAGRGDEFVLADVALYCAMAGIVLTRFLPRRRHS